MKLKDRVLVLGVISVGDSASFLPHFHVQVASVYLRVRLLIRFLACLVCLIKYVELTHRVVRVVLSLSVVGAHKVSRQSSPRVSICVWIGKQ